ncbi:rhomboid family intramembrane serine protease [Viscerimonas tarda]
MAGFIDNLKLRFKTGDILVKLLFINVFVFIALGILTVTGTLFKLDMPDIRYWVGVPASTSGLLSHPWTLLTYMFVHAGFFHIFFNMLLLYWFGKIFLTNFSQKNMGGLYILGGLAGAALYILAFNTIPYYREMPHSLMIGASASVMAIILASAFYRPQQELMLLFLGRIKIVYIAIFIFILDFLELGSSDNPGGHIAHIGGAILGYVFAREYLKGRDITGWLNRIIDRIFNLFKPGPKKMKVKYRKQETDQEYNQRKHQETENIDKILDKIKASGYSSLTSEEKKRLFDASNK